MQHQDWNTVILRNKTKQRENKQNTHPKTENTKMNKIANDTENYKPTYFTNGKQLINARTSKNWTRQKLANEINENVNLLTKYEQNQIIPDNRVLQKLRKCLNVRL